MTTTPSFTEETGLVVTDARECAFFTKRKLHTRDAVEHMEGLHRLAQAFSKTPEAMLQELAEAAVELCGADSAGISIETGEGADSFYHWVAAAGQYSAFFDARLPEYPSACGICLERNQPQHFLVNKRFFDILGVEAPAVTDGLLLPWKAGEVRGTIFVMAHGREEAFDLQDCRMLEMLADFAAMAVKQNAKAEQLLQQAGSTGAKSMAHDLAHRINNPLQSLTNLVYLASSDEACPDVRRLAKDLAPNLDRLTDVVRTLLAAPGGNHRPS